MAIDGLEDFGETHALAALSSDGSRLANGLPVCSSRFMRGAPAATHHTGCNPGRHDYDENRPSRLYAVVRIDRFHSEETPLEHRIAVKEIVSSLELAKAEVHRLNGMVADGRVTYFWQMTRLYPDGQSASTQIEPE